MSLPPLDRLRLTRTGEFYPLSEEQVDELNREGAEEPITQRAFQRDVGPEDLWHTFRVRLTQPDGSFKDQFYRAESLWDWYQRSAGGARPPTDPLTRQPVWYEDWWALHGRFDPEGTVPDWAYRLTKFDPASEDAQQPYAEDPNDATVVWTFYIKGRVPEQVVGGHSLVHEMRWLFSHEMRARWPSTNSPVDHWYERLDISKDVRHYPTSNAPEFLMHVTRYRVRLRLSSEQARQFTDLAFGLVYRLGYEAMIDALLGIQEAKRVGVWMRITRNGTFVPADQNEPLSMTQEAYEQWSMWSYRLHDDPPAPALALDDPDPVDLLTEERAAREQEVADHREMMASFENEWRQRSQNDDTSLNSLLWIHNKLTYHEQFIFVHLVRLAQIAGGADEAANLRASRWRNETEHRNTMRQEHLRAKRGEPANLSAAIEAAHADALAAIERIRERERDGTYSRRH